MHQLIILRHAKAMPAGAGVADFDRPLAEPGRRAAAAIGRAMREAGLTPDVVLVSPARRALETLDAACLWEEQPNIDTLPPLYMATRAQLADVLRALPETVRSVLVIGHNPGLHELIKWLAPVSASFPSSSWRALDDFPTAGLVEFLITSSWRRLAPTAAALQRFLEPSNLKVA